MRLIESPEKSQRLANLSPSDRYLYFLRKVSDFELVWSLTESGWATIDANGTSGVPFWPEQQLAQLCASGVWSRYRAQSIPLADFMTRWLPGMERDGRVVSVFPVSGGQSAIVTASQLRRDLEQELRQYE